MQQNKIAWLCIRKVSHHPIEIDASSVRIKIPVRDGFNAKVVQNRKVVGPGWVRHKDTAICIRITRQFKSLPHSTRSTRRRNGRNLISGKRVAQYEVDHHIRECRITGERCIRLGGLFFPNALLSGLYSTHNRRLARRILIHPDTKIDFVDPRVSAEHGRDLQDPVRGLLGKCRKHQASPVAIGKVSN